MQHTVALVQGIYFLITGIWPLIHMHSFLAITGPKTDLWLVKTVGLILAVIGAVLLYAQATATINPPVVALAIGSAASLALVDDLSFSRLICRRSVSFAGVCFANAGLLAVL